jgi:hypothetical protein
LHSNRTWLIFVVALFVLGAISYALGTLMLRRERRLQEEPLVLNQEDRLDMIERLVMVGRPWCVDELRTILNNDPDQAVRDAADAALLVIGSRGSHP